MSLDRVPDSTPAYFAMGQQMRKARMEDESIAQQKQRMAIAKVVFANGIDENSINQYGQLTGDVDATQGMLAKYRAEQKTKQEITNLKDTHEKSIMDHSRLQDDLVNQSYGTASAILSGIDWNDTSPEGLQKRNLTWQYFKQVAPHLAEYDQDNNLTRGIKIPDAPDANIAAHIINRGKDLKMQMDERKQKFDEYYKEKESKLALAKLEEDKRHNIAMESKATPEAEGIDPTTLKPYTESQSKNAKYAISMGRSIRNMDKLISRGFNEADIVNQVVNVFRKKKQISRIEFLNIAKTPSQKKYLQAQLDFMTSHLRDQSGAVINADEYATEAAQYFPLPGDDIETVAQKKEARLEEFSSRKTASGGMYDKMRKNIETDIESYKPKTGTKTETDDEMLDRLFPRKQK